MSIPINFKDYVSLRVKSEIAEAVQKLPEDARDEALASIFATVDGAEALYAGMDDGTMGTMLPYEVWDASQNGENLKRIMADALRKMGF